MPFDEPEENQDEAVMLPRRFGYPLPDKEDNEAAKIMQMAPTQAPSDEPGLQAEPKLSIGQRIVRIGNQGVPPFDVQDGRPVWGQDPQTLAKPSIGQRIIRASFEMRPARLSNTSLTMNGFSLQPKQNGLFNSFMPARTTPGTNGLDNRQAPQRNAGGGEALGRSAGQAAGALARAGLGAREAVLRPTATPDFRPNLNIQNPRQVRRTLGRTLAPLMQSIRDSQPPQAVRHLTQDDINEAAAVAYSENVEATLRDYEAIISTILNRVRSGDRQFVDPGQGFTVRNVTHSKAHGDQFQGVPNSVNYRGFATNHSQAAENARIAAENIAAHGPSHRWTFFIAPPNRTLPRDRERSGLGHNMRQVDRTDHVFLYAPRQFPHGANRGHRRGRAILPPSNPPQRQK